ncbi:MAG: zinc-dependent alcohol dehydrogenase [Planctomycetota bacterium]|jgi:2-desacetyl-2-hydroxyethyl bacteriochlorophyllide A dehydrogenase
MSNKKQAGTYQTLLFAGPRKIEFEEMSSAELKADEVRIETMYSGISRGTEMTIYRGKSPFYEKSFDADVMLFLKSDQPSWSYPMEFGYENIGRIVEAGSEVKGFKVGDVVFTPSQHTEYLVISATQTGPFFGDLVPILTLPPGLDPELGIFGALSGVAYNAMLDGKPLLGESVAIFGAGVIGLLTVQLCRLAGMSQIFIVDPIASRRELAKKFGATHAFDPGKDDDIGLAIRELTEGRGADLAIEVSGVYAGLHEAMRSVGYNGRVVVSSYLPGPAEKMSLGEEFHHNRIQLISSQSFGVHPDVSDRWGPARRTLAVMATLGKLDLAPMITHRFKFADAGKAFELVDKNPEEVLQVILEY